MLCRKIKWDEGIERRVLFKWADWAAFPGQGIGAKA